MRIFRHSLPRASAVALAATVASGCDMSTLVRATDPDIIGTPLVASPSGANALRLGALGRFNANTTGGESMFLYNGLLGDEFGASDTFTQRIETDQRVFTPQNANITTAHRGLHSTRMAAIQAREALTAYAPAAPAWNFGEMFFVEAYMLNLLAENFCNGQPISYIKNGVEELGGPVSNTAIFALVQTKIDSGLAALGSATGTNETRVRNSLTVLRGRVMLNQGNFAGVQAAVAAVPTNFVWFQEHAQTARTPGVWNLVNSVLRYSVSNDEGPLKMNYGTAADPRVPTCFATDAACIAAGFRTVRPFDNGNTSVPNMRYQLVWPTDASSVALMSGLQARLYEAEALNQTGNFPGALAILNALRAAPQGYGRTIAAMAPLTDPGTPAARRDMIFREKGMWLFGLGHRYNDMRRMMRQYGMTQTEVFPSGNTWQINRAPGYGTDVVFITPSAEAFNPNQPQQNGFPACTDKLP